MKVASSVLPPGYKGEVPDGYDVVRPSTFGNWFVFRAFVVDGSTKPGVEAVKKHLKIYQFSDADNPPSIKHVNGSGVPANFVAPGDYAFWSCSTGSSKKSPRRAAIRQRSGSSHPSAFKRAAVQSR